MPFLSRIRINPFREASRKLLTNPHAAHGAVVAGLPDPEGERPLWRWETERERRPHLLVLTSAAPDWTHLVERCGWPLADGDHVTTRDYTPLLRQLSSGREFAFRVTVNPVQNVPAPGSPGERGRARRVGHRTATHQQRWFLQRAERWGFHVPPALLGDTGADEVPDLRITQRQRLSFAKKKGGEPVVLHIATFEGRLRITEPDVFTRTLLDGIGPAKAYGCGLLTLAPLPQTARR
ncbi:type I-E CRISPR-associated protein Cas6/Cse3/CasE [Saccharomonospora xinjiangensis]|uniref:type I-E CRISPR-associated protein Cas6/Cse3/CasE n=1 Tax=Saccharomonospora xinjiangensis TaxID=75294 RepID=UPI003510B487